MRTGILYHGMIAAVLLGAAACGSKDKGDKNAAGNASTATANTAENTAEAAAARLAARVKDFNDANGGCEECDATEARVRVENQVPAGLRSYSAAPSCMNEARDTGEIREVTDDAAGLSDGNFAGAAAELLRNPAVQQLIARKVGGNAGRVLNGGDDRTAYCQAVCAVLPQNSTVTGYKLEAADLDRQYQTCAPGSDCAIGKAKWTAEPIPSTGDNSKTVCGVFANWSHKTSRLARLSVYFTPPADWVPPHR
jgi:hypothetical protein